MNRLNSPFAKSKRDTPPSSPKTTAPPTPSALCTSESETSLSDGLKDSEAVPPKKKSPFFRSTQASVERALDRLLEYGPGFAKTTLVLSPELLKVVPVPGVAEMARTLVSIWQETQRLDINRDACYNLVVGCAGFLTTIRQQVDQISDPRGAAILDGAVQEIIKKFSAIQAYLIEINNYSSFKAFAERDRIARRINELKNDLHQANLGFNNTVQVSMISHIQGLTTACGIVPMSTSRSAQSVRSELDKGLSQSDSCLRGMGMTPSPSSDSVGDAAPNKQPALNISFAAAGWSDGALPTRVTDAKQTYTSMTLSPNQIERVLARLRAPVEVGGAGYNEEQICRELAELRLFMSRAGNIQGRLLALLEEEGSQIPGALRALQLL
ncbi:hypothetical protein EV715DRAFT_206065 [Schizophyllum commune]